MIAAFRTYIAFFGSRSLLQPKSGGWPVTAAALLYSFAGQLRYLLDLDVVDKEADTFAVHGIGIERELVVVPFGRIG